jgi:pimeloyl-ACP methyl ester carboxylesterase
MLRRIEHPTRWVKRLGFVDSTVDDLVFDAVIRDFLALDTDTYRRYVQASADHDASDLLPDLPFPILAVAGERDRFLTASRVEEMAACASDAEYYEVRGATHFLPLEYYDLLALKIDDFVKRTVKT